MASVRILNYDCCRLMWKSCRFPAKGKPIAVQGCRLFREGDNFVLFRYSDRIASITPDSIFTLHVMPEGNMQWALGRIFNLRVHRYGKGKYRIGLQRTPMTDQEQLPRYFSGIRFDMFSHKCVNEEARPPEPVRVKDAAKELEWQRKLRAYVKGWKVRAKIGALANDIDKHIATFQQRYSPLKPATLVEVVESEDYGYAAALIVHNALSWYEAKSVADLGWEGFLRQQAQRRWGNVVRLESMFERVYRRHREDIYRMLDIVTTEHTPRLNPVL